MQVENDLCSLSSWAAGFCWLEHQQQKSHGLTSIWLSDFQLLMRLYLQLGGNMNNSSLALSPNNWLYITTVIERNVLVGGV